MQACEPLRWGETRSRGAVGLLGALWVPANAPFSVVRCLTTNHALCPRNPCSPYKNTALKGLLGHDVAALWLLFFFSFHASNGRYPKTQLRAPFHHFVCPPGLISVQELPLSNFHRCLFPANHLLKSSPLPAFLHPSVLLLLFISSRCGTWGICSLGKQNEVALQPNTRSQVLAARWAWSRIQRYRCKPPISPPSPAQLIAFYFSLWCCY